MRTGKSHDTVPDRLQIEQVISTGILARDSGDWAALAACYHPDARLTTSWFDGTVAAFVAGAREMKVARHEGESQKHLTGNHDIRIVGDRALAENDQILFQRRRINGVDLDFTTWSRRLHLLERREGAWRILARRMIYEKDRMDPVYPDQVPDDFYSSIDLSRYPPQIRYHCWRNDMAGFPPPAEICIIGTVQEAEVRREAEKWLHGEAAQA